MPPSTIISSVSDKDKFDKPPSQGEAAQSSRLSRLSEPSLPKGVVYYLNDTSAMEENQTVGHNFGKLARLKYMPLDILFEIAYLLEPLDILQLSRVTGTFRSTFASRHSRHIWIAARRNITPEMPGCPQDLTEPQYTCLMFEHHCQACGSLNKPRTDFSLRLRLCKPCIKINLQKGSSLLKPHREISPDILTLLPRSMLFARFHYDKNKKRLTFNSDDNSVYNYYYVPEVRIVLSRYEELRSSPDDLDAFVALQKSLASQMMKDVEGLTTWEALYTDQIKRDKRNRIAKWQASVEKRIIDEGWDRKYIPNTVTGRGGRELPKLWNVLFDPPQELNSHTWEQIYPKLLPLLERYKTNVTRNEKYDRQKLRLQELKPFWEEYTTSSNETQFYIMARFQDICDMPVISNMLFEDDATIPVTKERWLSIFDSIPSQLADFQNKFQRDLIKRLQLSTEYSVTSTASNSEQDSEQDLRILKRATSVFKCFACDSCLSYATMFEHEHTRVASKSWSKLLNWLCKSEDMQSVVRMVLDVAGLSMDASLEALEKLNGRLMCLCGHPEYKKPLSAVLLISHITREIRLDKERQRVVRHTTHNKYFEFHCDHLLTSAVPLIALIPENDPTTLERSNSEPARPHSGSDHGVAANSQLFLPHADVKCCKYCYALSIGLERLKSDEEAMYHMKAKHNREFTVSDVLGNEALLKWSRKYRQ